MKIITICLFLTLTLASKNLLAKTIRATELNNNMMTQLLEAKEECIIDFRKGDLITLNFLAQGDLFESENVENNNLIIKKDFLVKIKNDAIMVKIGNKPYLGLKDAITGNFFLSSISGGQIPGVIQAVLSVYLR